HHCEDQRDIGTEADALFRGRGAGWDWTTHGSFPYARCEVLQNTRIRIFSNTFLEYMTWRKKNIGYLYD
ncbi:MAG: hypothetical protein RR903_14010, partial [Edwardsiella sp. (in: enterobacteria)]